MRKQGVTLSNEYFTPVEVAQRLKVTKQAVYKWIADGRLEAIKVGKALRISKEALEAFLQPATAEDVQQADEE